MGLDLLNSGRTMNALMSSSGSGFLLTDITIVKFRPPLFRFLHRTGITTKKNGPITRLLLKTCSCSGKPSYVLVDGGAAEAGASQTGQRVGKLRRRMERRKPIRKTCKHCNQYNFKGSFWFILLCCIL